MRQNYLMIGMFQKKLNKEKIFKFKDKFNKEIKILLSKLKI